MGSVPITECKMIDLIFDAVKNPSTRTIDIWAKTAAGDVWVKNVTVNTERMSPTNIIGDPPIRLPYEVAQSLIDALWDAGVRPSSGEGHTAHIQALNAHLEDMRRLVFDKND